MIWKRKIFELLSYQFVLGTFSLVSKSAGWIVFVSEPVYVSQIIRFDGFISSIDSCDIGMSLVDDESEIISLVESAISLQELTLPYSTPSEINQHSA